MVCSFLYERSTLVGKTLKIKNVEKAFSKERMVYTQPVLRAGIKRFCMHVLRHTYVIREIKSGIQPKVLQRLLGHASIKTTMDRYVRVTTDTLEKAIWQFEANRVAEI